MLLALFGKGEAFRHASFLRLRARLVGFFRRTRCSFPEDMADEVLDRVARRLEEGVRLSTEALPFYCGGVARIVYRELLRDRNVHAERTPGLAHALRERNQPAGEWREWQLACLDACLARLPAADRSLLLAYYQGDDVAAERRRICRELAVSANSLRLRTHRLRRRVESELRELLEMEGGGMEGRQPAGVSRGTSGSSSRQTASPPW